MVEELNYLKKATIEVIIGIIIGVIISYFVLISLQKEKCEGLKAIIESKEAEIKFLNTKYKMLKLHSPKKTIDKTKIDGIDKVISLKFILKYKNNIKLKDKLLKLLEEKYGKDNIEVKKVNNIYLGKTVAYSKKVEKEIDNIKDLSNDFNEFSFVCSKTSEIVITID